LNQHTLVRTSLGQVYSSALCVFGPRPNRLPYGERPRLLTVVDLSGRLLFNETGIE